ncbi:staphopain proregion domain-containing protein, partial [Bacillus sp. JR_15]
MQTTSKYKLFKLLTFSIIVALLLSLSAITNIKTAQANQDSDQLEINVKSNKVPQKVEQLAQQQYVGYAQALDKQHNKQSGKYQLGEPFNIYKFNGEEDNSYYYPILKDGKIVYTLTISP